MLGILYVVLAVSVMFAPLSGYAVLSILFSISMLFSGLLEISFAVATGKMYPVGAGIWPEVSST